MTGEHERDPEPVLHEAGDRGGVRIMGVDQVGRAGLVGNPGDQVLGEALDLRVHLLLGTVARRRAREPHERDLVGDRLFGHGVFGAGRAVEEARGHHDPLDPGILRRGRDEVEEIADMPARIGGQPVGDPAGPQAALQRDM